MKLPRNISAEVLIKKLKPLGYEISRQRGSHIRLTTILNGEHHITIPNKDPIRIGTFSNIMKSVAEHFGKTKSQIIEELFS